MCPPEYMQVNGGNNCMGETEEDMETVFGFLFAKGDFQPFPPSSPRCRHEEERVLPQLQRHLRERAVLQHDQEDVLLRLQCGESLEQAVRSLSNSRFL